MANRRSSVSSCIISRSLMRPVEPVSRQHEISPRNRPCFAFRRCCRGTSLYALWICQANQVPRFNPCRILLRRMSLLLGHLTSSWHRSRQLVVTEDRQLRPVLLPVPCNCRRTHSLHRHPQRSMQAHAATAQQDEYHLLISSSNDGELATLRSSLSQEDVVLAPDATVVPCFELGSMPNQPQFNSAAFMRQLGTVRLGHTLLSAAELPSTQTLLQSNARRFSDGTVCVADVQSGGKGRGGNTWTSPRDCLMFSALMRLNIAGTRLPFVQYVASLALVQAIQEESEQLLAGSGQKLDVRIKWPNDLYAGPHKLGGILCQSVFRDQQFQVVIGVGLNVSNEQPSTCIDALLREEQSRRSPELSGSPSMSPEALLAAILLHLERHVQTLQTEGFQPIQADYIDSWLHTGQQVTWKGEAGVQDVSMRIQGLTPDGYLLAADDSGEQYSLSPDGNSLDFFEGLIRSKLPK